MKRTRLFHLSATLCLGLLVVSWALIPAHAPGASKPVKWVLSNPFGSESYGGKGTAWIIDRINKNSNGGLLIEPYYAGSLGYKSPEYLRVLKDGLVDMAEFSSPSGIGTEPLLGSCVLPLSFFSYDEYLKFAQGVLVPKLSGITEEKWNTKIIGVIMYPRVAFFAHKPITSIEDFKGMKIRVMGGLDPKIYKKLGAEPTYIPLEDLYTALQRGLVQAMPNSLTFAADVKVWEVCTHATLIGYVIGNGFMVVNKKSFDALPKDLQDVVTEAGAAYSQQMKQEITRMGDHAVVQFLDEYMTLTKIPTPVLMEVKKAAQEVWREWAEKTGPLAMEILKEGGLLQD